MTDTVHLDREFKNMIKEAVREVVAELDEADREKGNLPLSEWSVCKHCRKSIKSNEGFYMHHQNCFDDNIMQIFKHVINQQELEKIRQIIKEENNK